MNATTTELRTLAQIRAGIRYRAQGMTDARVARKAETTKTYARTIQNDAGAVERAVEWDLVAKERGERGVAA